LHKTRLERFECSMPWALPSPALPCSAVLAAAVLSVAGENS
jgi:hypothetical protein